MKILRRRWRWRQRARIGTGRSVLVTYHPSLGTLAFRWAHYKLREFAPSSIPCWKLLGTEAAESEEETAADPVLTSDPPRAGGLRCCNPPSTRPGPSYPSIQTPSPYGIVPPRSGALERRPKVQGGGGRDGRPLPLSAVVCDSSTDSKVVLPMVREALERVASVMVKAGGKRKRGRDSSTPSSLSFHTRRGVALGAISNVP